MDPKDLAIETDVLDIGDGRLTGRAVVTGDLDVSVTDLLESRLVALREAGATDLIVDATDVTFLDSSGLRALIHARNEFEGAGGTFIIDGMSPAVRRVLDLCGMLDLGALPGVAEGSA
ncbi:STAS domain-containing protein [Dermatobacter hominis]|uniref:STAS domain-containing protein n=1 Tax=Dermatobacter hominis TaxID=2884263 RepID=UPI001D1299C4|nr:STAS domain-containing protein [Dermatobacter hominis]UDY37463.1 STAS domain-containing protein [Dermatobacter hominis]